MAKRGRPKKVTTDVPKDNGKTAITEGTAPTNAESHDFDGADREALYEQRAEANPPESLLTGDEVEHDEINSGLEVTEMNDPLGGITGLDTEEPETDTSAEQEETEEPETELPEYDIFDEKELEKESMVPHGALHEERERRKERDKQVDQLLEDNKKLMERLAKQPADEFGLETDDSQTQMQLRMAMNKITQLEERLEQKDRVDQQYQQAEAQKQTENLVKDTAKKLDDEGFVGFDQLGRQTVSAKLQQIAQTYGAEAAKKYDNPEGWSKIWRAEQPKLREVFLAEHKDGLLNSKIANKKNATLITNPGKASVPKTKKDETLDDRLKNYMKDKAKYQLS